MPLFGLFKDSSIKIAPKAKAKKKRNSMRGQSLKQSLKKSLGKGVNIRDAVKLPEGENLDEWIAMNVVEMYNAAQYCFNYVGESCVQRCQKMTAGPKYSYLWCDEENEQYSKPTEVTAAQYVDLLFDWIANVLDDESIFPSTTAGKFGKRFLPSVKFALGKLCRVYFHIFNHHWEEVRSVNAEGFINTSFKFLFFFVREFGLVKKASFEPVVNMVTKFEEEDKRP